MIIFLYSSICTAYSTLDHMSYSAHTQRRISKNLKNIFKNLFLCFFYTERQHCPPHCFFGRADWSGEGTSLKWRKRQRTVSGKGSILTPSFCVLTHTSVGLTGVLSVCLCSFLSQSFLQIKARSDYCCFFFFLEWLHATLHGSSGKSLGRGATLTWKWFQSEHCYWGKVTNDNCESPLFTASLMSVCTDSP